MSTPRTQRGSIARRMWASGGKVGKTHLSFQVFSRRDEASNYGDYPSSVVYPVAVLDLREEAVEKMVKAVARALVAWERNRYGRVISGSHVHPMQARAALSCILPLRRGRGGK